MIVFESLFSLFDVDIDMLFFLCLLLCFSLKGKEETIVDEPADLGFSS